MEGSHFLTVMHLIVQAKYHVKLERAMLSP